MKAAREIKASWLLWITLMLLAFAGRATSAEKLDAQEAVCRKNLLLLHDAVAHHRGKNGGEMPASLSDLFPRYVADPAVLYCPKALAEGITSIGQTRRKDVRESRSSYFYEFHPASLGKPKGRTNREWKFAQMRLVGGEIPMVRCFSHGSSPGSFDHAVNLAFNGQIYESGLQWEARFEHLFAPADLSPERLLFANDGGRPIAVPSRSVDNTNDSIDLSAFYNLSLVKPTPRLLGVPNVLPIPLGTTRLNGMEFDLRGAIQLAWQQTPDKLFPKETPDIPVMRWCREVHFLHTAVGPSNKGTVLGHYTLQTIHNEQFVVPLVMGENISTANNPPPMRGTAAKKTAFEEMNLSAPFTAYHLVWTNPFPKVAIASVKLQSVSSEAGLLLLGISVAP